ncbi:MAG: helix-turn-helix domain-containing protein [Chryseolinea sp.]
MVVSINDKIEVHEGQLEYELPLFRELKELRRRLASIDNVPPYIILSDASLLELATYLPLEVQDFNKITGFGEVKVKKYAEPFGEVINQYCKERGINTKIQLLAPKVIKKERPIRDTDTKQHSLALLRKGHSIEQIGGLRKMTTSTIAGHLAFYVQNGQLNINELLNSSRIKVIREAILSAPGNALTPAKQLLGDNYSFHEIALVKAAIEYSRNEFVTTA